MERWVELAIGLIGIFVIIFLVISVNLFIWGSLITSGIKALSGSCGTDYGIEVLPMVFGNWFC